MKMPLCGEYVMCPSSFMLEATQIWKNPNMSFYVLTFNKENSYFLIPYFSDKLLKPDIPANDKCALGVLLE